MADAPPGGWQNYWSKINEKRARTKAAREKEATKRLLARAKRVPKKNGDNVRSIDTKGDGQG